MNRYSLPQQANVFMGMAAGATCGLLMLTLHRSSFEPGYLALAAGLVLIGSAIGFSIPARFTRWATDRRPFCAMAILALIYLPILVLSAVILPPHESTFRVTGAPGVALYLILFLWPLTLLSLATFTVGGGCLFRYLGGRRDYL